MNQLNTQFIRMLIIIALSITSSTFTRGTNFFVICSVNHFKPEYI